MSETLVNTNTNKATKSKEENEVLLRLMEESMIHARHLESQRSGMTNFLITISTAIIAFIIEKKVVSNTLPLSIVLIIIGCYGSIVSLKYSQRFHLHYMRAKSLRLELTKNFPDVDFLALEDMAEEKNRKKFPLITGVEEKFELFYLWLILYITITIVGIIFIFSTL